MKRSRPAVAAPAVLAGAVAGLALVPMLVAARSDGPEWTAADTAEGCRSCHLSAAPPAASAPGAAEPHVAEPVAADTAIGDAALSIDGLPATPEPGAHYALTIRLADPALRNAGFLLRVAADGEADGKAAGELAATDERAETDGPRARSTWDGQWPVAPGLASWQLEWTAPDPVPGGIRFDLWGNAGNDDLSPLGDSIHHLTLRLPTMP